MKDKEYIRQWCVSEAVAILRAKKISDSVDVEEALCIAKELEEYITGKKRPIFAAYSPKK